MAPPQQQAGPYRPEPEPYRPLIRPITIVKPVRETIVERTYVENAPGRTTDPLTPIVVVNIPSQPHSESGDYVASPTPYQEGYRGVRNDPPRRESQRDRGENRPIAKPSAPADVTQPSQPVAPVADSTPPEQNQFAEPNKTVPAATPEPNKKSSPEEVKTVPPDEQNNSETIHPSELIGPDKPAPQAETEGFKKVGKPAGRQRRYDELGENDIEPIRELFLLRHLTGKHWPGLSKDMENYYERFYFTKPKRGEKDYERHVKCWQRRTKWLAEHTA